MGSKNNGITVPLLEQFIGNYFPTIQNEEKSLAESEFLFPPSREAICWRQRELWALDIQTVSVAVKHKEDTGRGGGGREKTTRD